MTVGPVDDELSVTHRGRQDASAPVVVLLHGLTDSGDCWPDAVRRWEADYHLVTVDARGHGRSPRWSDDHLEHVGETLRDDTIRVLESLQAEPNSAPVLVGHSMGGASAWAAAVQRPDLVRALVLEDPAIPAMDPAALGEAARRQLQAAREAPGVEEDPPDDSLTGPWDWPEIELEPWARAKQLVDERMVATGVVCVSAPWPQVWSSLAMPTLVVTGTDRVIMDAEHQQAVAELANPHITLRVVPDAGHCVRRCNPEGYHSLVDPFLAEVCERGPSPAG